MTRTEGASKKEAGDWRQEKGSSEEVSQRADGAKLRYTWQDSNSKEAAKLLHDWIGCLYRCGCPAKYIELWHRLLACCWTSSLPLGCRQQSSALLLSFDRLSLPFV